SPNIKGRSIVIATLDIISTIRSQEKQLDQAWLFFLDQKKVFDKQLLRLLKQKLNGVPTGLLSFKITAYADDLIVGIDTTENWTTLINLLSKYKAIVNAAVNTAKKAGFDKLDKNGQLEF
ncbi:19404_t:CDS:2, partial [Gigaspora rosea]